MAEKARPRHAEVTVRVADRPLLTACWGRFPAGLALEPHAHDTPVVAVALRGVVEEVFPRRSDTCGPATVFTEPAGEPHRGRVGREGVQVVLVQPADPSDDAWRRAASLLEDLHRFRDGRVAGLAGRLAAELRLGEGRSDLEVEALATELVDVAAGVPGADAREEPPWLARVRDLLHACFLDRPTIGDLADEADVHPAHLARVFRRHYRVPLGTYARRLCLEWAALRLLESDDPISAVALQAGFYDQSHFTHAFKRHIGRTPAGFRAAR